MSRPHPHPLLPLDVRDVFVEYDGPQLFSCVDANGEMFIAQSVEDDGEAERILLSSIEAGQLVRLAAGRETLRAAFDGSLGNELFVVTIPRSDIAASVAEISAAGVPASWLPEPDVFLLVDAEAGLLLNSEWVEETVSAEEPTAAMSLRLQRKKKSLFSLRELSGVLSSLQGAVDAVGQRLDSDTPSSKGRIGQHVLGRTEMRIAALGTGSVLVDLVAAEDEALVQSDLATDAVATLFGVLRDLSSADPSLRSFDWLHLRAKLKVKELLEELAWSEASVESLVASPRGKASLARLTEDDIVNAVRHIRLDHEISCREISVVATWVGGNIRTRGFEIEATDEEARVYKGKVTAAARYKLSGVALESVYRVTLIECDIPDSVTGETKHTYELIDLEPAEAVGESPSVPE